MLPQPSSRYPEAYHQIANALKASGMTDMGVRDEARYLDKDGVPRASSLDLGKDNRIGRTLAIINLSSEQLADLHAREKRKGFFVYQITKMFKQNYAYSMSDERNEAIESFQNEHRPEPRKFRGVSVPPYFPPDNEFDGMEYHQAWDLGIWHNKNQFSMPATKRQSGRKVMSDE